MIPRAVLFSVSFNRSGFIPRAVAFSAWCSFSGARVVLFAVACNIVTAKIPWSDTVTSYCNLILLLHFL